MREKIKYNIKDNRLYTLKNYLKKFKTSQQNSEKLTAWWNELPEALVEEEKYDSTVSTLEHKLRVSELIGEFCINMTKRAAKHDNSKLSNKEKSAFDSETPKLKNLTYDSKEYKESLKTLGTALTHHYKNNSHHPEHYKDGVDEMNLFDIVEMLFDWKAATERHADGNIHISIEKNKERFKISEQLSTIFKNTASDLSW